MGTRLRDRLSSTCRPLEQRETIVELTQGMFTAANEMRFQVPRMKDSTWGLKNSKYELISVTNDKCEQTRTLPQNSESHRLQAWASYKQ